MSEGAPAPPPLAELAREGALRREAAAREDAERQRREQRQERRTVRRLGLGHLLEALVERPRVPRPPVFLWAAGAILGCTAVGLSADWLGLPDGASLLVIVGAVVVPAAYFGERRWSGVRLLRRERAWLQDLPFPVFGYFHALSGTPEEEGTVQVRLRLRGQGPPREVMEGLAGRAGGAVRVEPAAGGWRLESGPILSPAVGDIDPTNGPRLSWMRAVIEETLLPLHAVHPVRSVEFRA